MRVIEVVTQGPTGPQGPAGPQGSSVPFTNIGNGVYATTSSLQVSGSFLISGSSTFTNIGPAMFSGSISVSGSLIVDGYSAVTTNQTSSLNVLSASYASTASLAPNYVLNSVTSSFVQNNQTSSFVTNSQTSSMSVATASYASTASLAPNYVLNSATSSFITNTQTGSFATTGSNQFNGNQTITGSLIQGLGNAAGEQSHAEGDSTQAIGLFSHAEGLGTIAYGGRSHAEGQDTIASGSYSHAEGYQTIALADHQHVQGQWNATSSVPAAFIVGNGTDDSNRSNLIHAAGNEFQITGSFLVSGSSRFTGTQIITGSTQGNVTALSISSATASLDLSQANYFTLQLISGSNTYIDPINIHPGQTSILTISTTGSATVTWPSSVKQPSGSTYVPTTTTSVDIITLASVNSSTLYVVGIKNMI
jgi:hypothetical protein